jgi:TolB-like protein/Flp pilus assembly protein TadD
MTAKPESDLKFEIGHVLFIDIVGFSKLLINEQSELVRKLNEVVRGAEQVRSAEADGKLVQLPTGDGMALVFRDIPEAPAKCALEISRAFKNHPELRVRMGIHSGPVNEIVDVNERANITGAGINTAQRVMDCGDAGHILLSKRVADDLAQYERWQPHLYDLGECEVKHGVKIEVVNLYTGEIGNQDLPEKLKRTRQEHAASAIPEKSIAVLPFENASGNPDTEYLSDGISEALINSLTELQQLKVIARATAFRYKGKQVDPQAVGRELNVRAVLMGLVRQVGDRLNVQVDLVDASSGAQLWGEEYERKVADVLVIKQTIAREVTEKLRLKLTGEQQHTLAKRDTTNPEAFQFYLRGRYYWNKRTAEAIKKAIGEFRQAIERDPNYALGYVGLADCFVVLEEHAGAPASETLPKARAAAERALQIDDSLAEAHAALAYTYQNLWRWAEAEEEYKRAVSLNPNYPTAHHWFATYFSVQRRFDEARREIKRAQELDPLSQAISYHVAQQYLLKNAPDSAIEQCQKIIELYPHYPGAHKYLGFAYLAQRRGEEATAEFQRAAELSGRASLYLRELGYCYAVTGRRRDALAILKELEEKYAKREAIGQYLAGVYAGLGDKAQAFAWLEKDFQQHSGLLPDITWEFTFADLRSDPRYTDLIRRMGLEP